MIPSTSALPSLPPTRGAPCACTHLGELRDLLAHPQVHVGAELQAMGARRRGTAGRAKVRLPARARGRHLPAAPRPLRTRREAQAGGQAAPQPAPGPATDEAGTPLGGCCDGGKAGWRGGGKRGAGGEEAGTRRRDATAVTRRSEGPRRVCGRRHFPAARAHRQAPPPPDIAPPPGVPPRPFPPPRFRLRLPPLGPACPCLMLPPAALARVKLVRRRRL